MVELAGDSTIDTLIIIAAVILGSSIVGLIGHGRLRRNTSRREPGGGKLRKLRVIERPRDMRRVRGARQGGRVGPRGLPVGGPLALGGTVGFIGGDSGQWYYGGNSGPSSVIGYGGDSGYGGYGGDSGYGGYAGDSGYGGYAGDGGGYAGDGGGGGGYGGDGGGGYGGDGGGGYGGDGGGGYGGG